MAAKAKSPQLSLRLELATPDVEGRWRDGARLAYLGATVILRLGSAHKEPTLQHGELHLPLPPEASPRQVQDAAESWLRARALRVVSAQVVMEARRLARPVPPLALSFSARTGWMRSDDRGGLRCHWRLIEQPEEMMAQVVARAVAGLPAPMESLDLFAMA